MRGSDELTGSMFSYVNIEARIPANHPIRIIRRIVNEVLAGLDAAITAMYSGSVGLQLHLRGYCAARCCRSFSRSVQSASLWNRWATTLCFAGSWVSLSSQIEVDTWAI